MSENNEGNNFIPAVYDYLEDNEHSESPANEVKVEETINTVIKDDDESVIETETEEKDKQPWESKKSDTPVWAKKRFKEYSTTVRELKEQNQQLMDTVKNTLGQLKPQTKNLTKADFPDEESFIDFKAEQKAKEQLEAYDNNRVEQDKLNLENQQLQNADIQNVKNAMADLPDYDEALSNGDPDIRLSSQTVKHLAISPAGPYVKYRLATDDGLAEEIKHSTPDQKQKIISELHDSILNVLIERNKNGNQDVPATSNISTEVNTQNKAPRHQPPKAPPRVKGKGSAVNINSLTGDAYVKARNEQLRK